MNRFFLLLSFISMAVGVTYSQEQFQNRQFRDLTSQQQKDQATAMLRAMGVPSGQMPDIRLSDQLITNEEGTSIGKFLTIGDRFEGTRITVPTLVLYPNAVQSIGELEIAVRHEYLHYAAEANPPEALQELWSNLQKQIEDRFDLSDIPGSARDAMTNALIDFAKARVEHVYIAEELLRAVNTVTDFKNAMRTVEYQLDLYKRELDEFYKTPKSFIIGDREYTAKPRKGRSDDADPRLGEISGIAGIYDVEGNECELGPTGVFANSMSTYDDDSIIVSSNMSFTLKRDPVEISQVGQTVSLRQYSEHFLPKGKYTLFFRDGTAHYQTYGSDFRMYYGWECAGSIKGNTVDLDCTFINGMSAYSSTALDSDRLEQDNGFEHRSRIPASYKLTLVADGGILFNLCRLKRR